LSSARVTKVDSANFDSLDQNTSDLLFELAGDETPVSEVFDDAYRPASHDDSDVEAVDELFAELAVEWVGIGTGA
jgi:hypothetical protein